MTASKVCEVVEGFRYHSASAGEVRHLTIGQLTLRISKFNVVHRAEMRFRAQLAGAKI